MMIPIDESTRIVGTSRSWELQRLRNRKGAPFWEPFKWFSTFRQALEEAVHREIRLHPAQTLDEAISAVSDVIRRVRPLIPSEFRLSK